MKSIINFLTKREGNTASDLMALFIIFGFAFFQRLGQLPLLEPDEGRYAEIPREMIERGDFITPFLNYVKYFEKPPLHYWLSAISFKVFGFNEFAARFPGAIMGLLGVLLTYHVGRKLFGRRTGLLSAIILGTSTGYLVLARFNVIDMTLSVCMAATLGFFLLGSRDAEKNRGLYFHLFYLCAALTVLAKGLIGLVLPGAVVFLYMLLTGRWRLLREMRLLTGIPLFLLVAAPWFILVSLRNPEFARFFFIHEHFERFLTKVHGRYKPAWFFVPVLAGGLLPWSFFLPAACRKLWDDRSFAKDDGRLFLVLWASVIFGFFSISSSKLIPYIFPIFPALAILAGDLFSRAMESEKPLARIASYLLAGIMLLAGIGFCLYPHLAPAPKLSIMESGIIGAIFLVEGVTTFAALRKGSLATLFLALSLMSYILGIIAPTIILAKATDRKSSRDLGLLLREKAGNDALITSFGIYNQGLNFYCGRRVILVDITSELVFGSMQGDQSAWFIDRAAFFHLWDSPAKVFTFIRDDDAKALERSVKTPVRIIGRKGDKLIIANH